MNEPQRIRKNTIAFTTGPKGSGKSVLLDRYFTSRAPRVIHLDFVGEIHEKYPDAPETVGLLATVTKLQEFARAGLMEWHLIAVFPEHFQHELPKLFTLLCPVYEGHALTRVGISRAFGGVALECSECDVILPNSFGDSTRAARNMLKRGRHERLDLYLGTQRPQECSRVVTSQADYIIAFQMHEPRELEYLARGAGIEFAERVRLLPQFHSLWFHRSTRAIVEMDKDGQVVARIR